MNLPTFTYMQGGYTYNETSEAWAEMCKVLPCFRQLQWKGYPSTYVETRIDNHNVVIQLWKGTCQKFLGIKQFPGGMGAEVGVYRRLPKGKWPNMLDIAGFLGTFTDPFKGLFNDFLKGVLGENDVWWPFAELNAKIQFSLVNPFNNQPLVSAGPEHPYWLAKWMNEASYLAFRANQGGTKIPDSPDGYQLKCSVGSWSYTL